MGSTICLIEDDDLLGETLCDRFRLEGLEFDWFREGRPALEALKRRPFAVVLCDLRLPDGSGAELFEALEPALRPPFVFMTGFGSIDEAVALLKAGAVDFMTKPFDLDEFMLRVHQFCRAKPIANEPVLGLSPSMRKIEALLTRLADSVEPMLISGESGVGKEVVARLLHEKGAAHRGGEWVAVNCAAIPEALIEAELFGYVRGAFTGAARAHKGFIEQANGGTIFLDEIGDMPLNMQARLLRVLQNHEVTRIGAESATPVDFRLICATHRDLPALVRAGQFREDLYYRINVIAVQIPPLRERREDILWLADRMLGTLRRSGRQKPLALSLAAQQSLFAHAWPGNVRELNHALRRAVALGTKSIIDAGDIFEQPDARAALGQAEPPASLLLSEHLRLTERAHLLATLQAHDGAIGEAATALGISRKTLWEKMRRYAIDRRSSVESSGVP